MKCFRNTWEDVWKERNRHSNWVERSILWEWKSHVWILVNCLICMNQSIDWEKSSWVTAMGRGVWLFFNVWIEKQVEVTFWVRKWSTPMKRVRTDDPSTLQGAKPSEDMCHEELFQHLHHFPFSTFFWIIVWSWPLELWPLLLLLPTLWGSGVSVGQPRPGWLLSFHVKSQFAHRMTPGCRRCHWVWNLIWQTLIVSLNAFLHLLNPSIMMI